MISIHNNFLEEDQLKLLYDHFYYGGQKQFDFFDNESINVRSTHIENSIDKVITAICNIDYDFYAKAGYEVWANTIYKASNGLDLHVDCNEEADIEDHCKRTAVIHIGKEDTFTGGNLLVEASGNKYTSETISSIKPKDFILIPFKDNRLITFDGFHPHKVTPINSNYRYAARVTLTIAAWDKKINIVRHNNND